MFHRRRAITVGTAFAVALGLAGLVATTSGGVATAGGGCHAERLTSGQATEIALVKACFEPMVTYVAPGATVTWINGEPVEHMVTGAGNSWGNFEALSNGQSFAHTFRDAGVFPYYCLIHPSMVGAVVVGMPPDAIGAGAAVPAGVATVTAAVVADAADSDDGPNPLWLAVGAGAVLAVGMVAAGGAWFMRSRTA